MDIERWIRGIALRRLVHNCTQTHLARALSKSLRDNDNQINALSHIDAPTFLRFHGPFTFVDNEKLTPRGGALRRLYRILTTQPELRDLVPHRRCDSNLGISRKARSRCQKEAFGIDDIVF